MRYSKTNERLLACIVIFVFVQYTMCSKVALQSRIVHRRHLQIRHPQRHQLSLALGQSARTILDNTLGWQLRYIDKAISTAVAFSAVVGLAIAFPALVSADEGRTAAAVFNSTCAGCHAGGGNIVRPNATLRMEDLKKYDIADPSELYKIIYSGRASMPGYGKECAPKGACTFGPRLSDEEVQGLANFVYQQAQNGWQT